MQDLVVNEHVKLSAGLYSYDVNDLQIPINFCLPTS